MPSMRPCYFVFTSIIIYIGMISVTATNVVRRIEFKDCANICRKLISVLDASNHKGQNGRIAVLGGSPDYTGAPYYAAQSSLKFGADLSFVFCAKQASTPIKSYSPELMVNGFYDAEESSKESFDEAVNNVVQSFPRIHTLVIGPGLGRNQRTLDITSVIISAAIQANIPLVIDADGLFLISQNPDIIKNYQRCILTPNRMEFDRLITSTINQLVPSSSSSTSSPSSLPTAISMYYTRCLHSEDVAVKLRALCQWLGGVTILLKGASDMISSGDDVFILQQEGSPRRCGGQGDILAGSLGVATFWATKLYQALPTSNDEICKLLLHQEIIHELESLPSLLSPSSAATVASQWSSAASSSSAETPSVSLSAPTPATCNNINNSISSSNSNINISEKNAFIWAAMLAAAVTKQASRMAFQIKKRSMTSPDVIECIGQAFECIAPSSSEISSSGYSGDGDNNFRNNSNNNTDTIADATVTRGL